MTYDGTTLTMTITDTVTTHVHHVLGDQYPGHSWRKHGAARGFHGRDWRQTAKQESSPEVRLIEFAASKRVRWMIFNGLNRGAALRECAIVF